MKRFIYLQFVPLLLCSSIFANEYKEEISAIKTENEAIVNSDTQANLKKKQPDNIQTLYALGNIINLRQMPSTNSQIAGKCFFGEKLIATKKNGQWYAVKNRKGMPCWVSQSVVGDSARFEEVKMLKYNLSTVPIEENINTENNTDSSFLTGTGVPVIDSIHAVPKKNLYAYNKKGRDPFLPLDKSNFIREGLPNINNITLVGILYDSDDAIALFEEKKNNVITSFSMKIGDPVVSGKLLRIDPNKVIFLMRESNFSYTVEKELNIN